jgi:branched-chain amino acid aminotransferase
MALVPFHDRDGWIWMNGSFVPWREAQVHICTHALHYGSAVFEGERAYNGEIFKSLEHSRRLHKSANLLGFELPFSVEDIEAAKKEALIKNGMESCYVRPLAWRGSGQMGVSAKEAGVNVAVAVWAWGDYYPDRMKGIRMTMAKWRRPDPRTSPCESKAAGLYMICTLSKHAAEDEGFADALMLDWRGRVAEATSANIFFVREGEIHTPDPDCFLNGITRQTVIAIARSKGITVHERAIWPDELGTFTECFTTGSAAEITPVAEIAGRTYKPGDLTEDLMASFSAMTSGRNAIAA